MEKKVSLALIFMGLAFLSTGTNLLGKAILENGEPKKQKAKSKSKEEILQLFVSEFVKITPSTGKFPSSFEMGSEKGEPSEKPVHKVTFAYPFSMAKYEVTQELYEVIMGENPSRWKGPRNSVEKMSWKDAWEFCRKVTKELRDRKLIGESQEVRLPTEAEWEYTCRAGTTSEYSFGDDVNELTHYGWYRGNSKGHDPPVGAKKPNPWGLYDMHGYVWEWVADDWSENYENVPTDGSSYLNPKAEHKVMRGGSWAHPAEQCRSAFRQHASPDAGDDKIGFRCVLAEVKKKKQ